MFRIDRTVVTRYIKNIFKSGELDENSVCANFAHMGKLGVQEYNVKYYNLDVILAVGYRTNSAKGILFRKWANNILKRLEKYLDFVRSLNAFFIINYKL